MTLVPGDQTDSALTLTISPVMSLPEMCGSSKRSPCHPRRTQISRWLSATALTLIRACPGPGFGSGSSANLRTSMPPCCSKKIAFIAFSPGIEQCAPPILLSGLNQAPAVVRMFHLCLERGHDAGENEGAVCCEMFLKSWFKVAQHFSIAVSGDQVINPPGSGNVSVDQVHKPELLVKGSVFSGVLESSRIGVNGVDRAPVQVCRGECEYAASRPKVKAPVRSSCGDSRVLEQLKNHKRGGVMACTEATPRYDLDCAGRRGWGGCSRNDRQNGQRPRREHWPCRAGLLHPVSLRNSGTGGDFEADRRELGPANVHLVIPKMPEGSDEPRRGDFHTCRPTLDQLSCNLIGV